MIDETKLHVCRMVRLEVDLGKSVLRVIEKPVPRVIVSLVVAANDLDPQVHQIPFKAADVLELEDLLLAIVGSLAT